MKAFPTMTTNNEGNEVRCGGMDLRDYFAAKAMQGMLSNYQWSSDDSEISKLAYGFADAMMKAREQ